MTIATSRLTDMSTLIDYVSEFQFDVMEGFFDKTVWALETLKFTFHFTLHLVSIEFLMVTRQDYNNAKLTVYRYTIHTYYHTSILIS